MEINPIAVKTFHTRKSNVNPHGGARGKVKGPPMTLGFISWGHLRSEPNFLLFFLVDVDLLVALNKKPTSLPLEMINVCPKFHDNPCNYF